MQSRTAEKSIAAQYAIPGGKRVGCPPTKSRQQIRHKEAVTPNLMTNMYCQTDIDFLVSVNYAVQ
jgi:hypothetical protein